MVRLVASPVDEVTLEYMILSERWTTRWQCSTILQSTRAFPYRRFRSLHFRLLWVWICQRSFLLLLGPTSTRQITLADMSSEFTKSPPWRRTLWTWTGRRQRLHWNLWKEPTINSSMEMSSSSPSPLVPTPPILAWWWVDWLQKSTSVGLANQTWSSLLSDLDLGWSQNITKRLVWWMICPRWVSTSLDMDVQPVLEIQDHWSKYSRCHRERQLVVSCYLETENEEISNYIKSTSLLLLRWSSRMPSLDPRWISPKDPIAVDKGKRCLFKDIWPQCRKSVISQCISPEMFRKYADVFNEPRWQSIDVDESDLYPWSDKSTTFDCLPSLKVSKHKSTIEPIHDANVLLKLGDSVTTDHILRSHSCWWPCWNLSTSPWCAKEGLDSFGSRRGNHEVMMRGTFANVAFAINSRLEQKEATPRIFLLEK